MRQTKKKAAPTTSPTTINTILFSLPTSSTSAKLISFIINLSLLGMVADFTLRPLLNSQNDLVFTRVGAVYHDAAKIIVRYPGEESGVRIVWKQSNGGGSSGSNATLENDDNDESGWTDGPLVKLSPDQDWVGAAKLENLWTSTTYQCALCFLLNSIYFHIELRIYCDRSPCCLREFVFTALPFKSYHV